MPPEKISGIASPMAPSSPSGPTKTSGGFLHPIPPSPYGSIHSLLNKDEMKDVDAFKEPMCLSHPLLGVATIVIPKNKIEEVASEVCPHASEQRKLKDLQQLLCYLGMSSKARSVHAGGNFSKASEPKWVMREIAENGVAQWGKLNLLTPKCKNSVRLLREWLDTHQDEVNSSDTFTYTFSVEKWNSNGYFPTLRKDFYA